jgi:hypothetical protein
MYMYMLQIAKNVMFSEGCSAVSIQKRRGVTAGTQKSMKIRFKPYVSPEEVA